MTAAMTPPPVTLFLATRAAAVTYDTLPEPAITVARQCIPDSFAVTIAGAWEPAMQILRDDLLAGGAWPLATLVGFYQRSAAMHAALIDTARTRCGT